VNHVTKTYGTKYALDDITFSINEGDVLAYLGPNGSGKTTTLKSILGLIEIQAGDIQILGSNVQKHYTSLYGAVASLFDENGLYERLSARENLSFYLEAFQQKEELASALHLMEELDMGDEIDRKVSTYSKGMKRKLALVRSLSIHSKLLFMDEPFDGIDIENRAKIIQVIYEYRKKYGMTMMLTSHVMADVEDLASRIIIIKKGKILIDESLDRFSLHEGKDMTYRYLKAVEDE
jgi:ABC-2 type transport system ATP-binding protein